MTLPFSVDQITGFLGWWGIIGFFWIALVVKEDPNRERPRHKAIIITFLGGPIAWVIVGLFYFMTKDRCSSCEEHIHVRGNDDANKG